MKIFYLRYVIFVAVFLVNFSGNFSLYGVETAVEQHHPLGYSLERTKLDLLRIIQEFESKIHSLSRQLDSIQNQIELYYPHQVNLVGYAQSVRLSIDLFQSVLELHKSNELDHVSMHPSSLLFDILNVDHHKSDVFMCPCYSLKDIYTKLVNDWDNHAATVCYLLINLIDFEVQQIKNFKSICSHNDLVD